MMHSPEVRQRLLERLAQGWNLVRNAPELGVASTTLMDWSQWLSFRLQNQTAIEFDDLRHRLLGPLKLLRIFGLVTRTGFWTGNRPIFP